MKVCRHGLERQSTYGRRDGIGRRLQLLSPSRMTRRQKRIHSKQRGTPLDKSRVEALTEQVKKLNMEKDMLLNKNKKLRTMLTHEKRKSGKVEAELFRSKKKMKRLKQKLRVR